MSDIILTSFLSIVFDKMRVKPSNKEATFLMNEMGIEQQGILVDLAMTLAGTKNVFVHKFANKPGHMVVVETNCFRGFDNLLTVVGNSDLKDLQIEIIRTIPGEE
jgi:hypothetical protein